MKYIVFSDSHGMKSDMEDILFKEKADAVIYLGDGLDDITEVMNWFPGMGLVSVKGNCDFFRSGVPGERTIVSDGCTVICTHGNAYGVKEGLYNLEMHGRDCGASAVLYGHTHIQEMHTADKLLVMNPGSVGFNGEYGVLLLESGKATGVLKKIR